MLESLFGPKFKLFALGTFSLCNSAFKFSVGGSSILSISITSILFPLLKTKSEDSSSLLSKTFFDLFLSLIVTFFEMIEISALL